MNDIDRKWLRDLIQERSVHVSESGCLLWMGAMSKLGYGSVRIKRKGYSTHRLSYYANHGEIPDGLQVLHSCDVRCCVNPNHLRVGTNFDNQRDRLKRGRHHKTKLLPDDVMKIRKALTEQSCRQVSEAFNIPITAVYQINNGSSWAWLEEEK